MSFVLAQQLVAALSNTMAPDGTSRGSAALSQDQAEALHQRLALNNFIEGSFDASPPPSEEVIDFRVVSVDVEPVSFPLPGGNCDRTRVNLTCDVETASGCERAEFQLGLLAIEEGIAYEIDRMIALRAGNRNDDAPAFPYLVLRRFAEVHGPDQLPRVVLVACAILALLTTDPPKTLFLVLEHLSKGSSPRDKTLTVSMARLLDDVVEATKQNRENGASAVLKDLHSIVDMHRDRGLAEHAANHLVQLYSSMLRRRMRTPFWELEPFLNNEADPARLASLIARNLPCDFVQEREGEGDQPERDALLRFGPEEVDGVDLNAALDAVRTLQCQLHMFEEHRQNDGLAPSANIVARCPFYTSCDRDLRRLHADVCNRAPWQIYSLRQKDACFYGAAVAGLLGMEVQNASDGK
ncbi:hypothetical protein WME88_51890 [Sorangium sp. So ce216]